MHAKYLFHLLKHFRNPLEKIVYFRKKWPDIEKNLFKISCKMDIMYSLNYYVIMTCALGQRGMVNIEKDVLIFEFKNSSIICGNYEIDK